MDNILVQDSISDLPQSIVETILTKIPIKDAVRTSILSSKWRYKWANLTCLVFDDRCANLYNDKGLVEGNLVNFITRFLFLHDGPIHMFTLSSTYLQGSPYIDQWLLFISRKDVKELVIELGDSEWFRAPSCLFSCRKLTRLELIRCELDPPSNFKGFLSLKCLVLQQVLIAPDKVEILLSSCPLLESLTLSYNDSFSLSIRAPNLKYLCLEGEFKDIRLENTPLLTFVSVSMYMTDDTTAEHFEQSSCNFDKFLGGVPCLQRLIGYIYFTKVRHQSNPFLLFPFLWTRICVGFGGLNSGIFSLFFCPKYLSVGNELRNLPITYSHLKIVELYEVSFEDMKEILVVLRLILNSPVLQELHMSSSSNTSLTTEAPDLDFWENECPSDCTFRLLKTVKIADISGVPHEMEFIKFLLRNSPVLEIMSIIPSTCVTDGRVNMLIELLRFRRASAEAEITFTQN